MNVIDAIVDRTGLSHEMAREVMSTILDFGIPLYSIEELDGWYTDLDDLRADSLMYPDQVMSVTFAVEFDRRPIFNGVIA